MSDFKHQTMGKQSAVSMNITASGVTRSEIEECMDRLQGEISTLHDMVQKVLSSCASVRKEQAKFGEKGGETTFIPSSDLGKQIHSMTLQVQGATTELYELLTSLAL